MNFSKLKLIIFFVTVLVSGCNHSNDISKRDNYSSGYIQAEQGKLFYQAYGSEEPIIVLHDGPGLDHSYLLPQMLDLAKDHRVIFYDQRGSGKSLDTKMTSSVINMNRFVQDLEAVRMQLGIKKFVLLGHAWGGLLAMNYAIKHPENLSGLILLNTVPADYQGMQLFEKGFINRTKPIESHIKPLCNVKDIQKLTQNEISKLERVLFSVYFYNSKDVAKLSLNMTEASTKGGAEVMKLMTETSSLKPESKLLTQLKKINVPTLVIHGKEDIIPISTAEKIHEAIPHSVFISLEECGHFAYIEKPLQTFGSIRNFLIEKQDLSIKKKLKALESSFGGRIGISAINTANNSSIEYRADERFPMQSTFKLLGVAAILKQSELDKTLLQQKITFTKPGQDSWSPITTKSFPQGMTIQELCAAAMKYSDDGAINLLMKKLGGPEAITAFARSIGDKVFRVDHLEPKLNSNPNDISDTSTPQSMQISLQKLALGTVLAPNQRNQLITWMKGNTTGDTRIRAGVPEGWVVADKTGAGKTYGLSNDIAIIWPPKHPPILLSIYSIQNHKNAIRRDDIIASVTRMVITEFAKNDENIFPEN